MPDLDLGAQSNGWPSQLRFLSSGGNAGELMRTQDWSNSSLGHPETWPQSLRSVVGLLLNSKFPMFVAWGAELGFLYNDAYAEILGAKHPTAMGGKFREIWAEIWPTIEPLIQAAMDGEATFHEDLPLLMNRHGFEEETWFTFSYSPVRDEAGDLAGMFCAVSETTKRVRLEKRLAGEQARLANLFEKAPVFLAQVEGADHRFALANPSYLDLVGRQNIIGQGVADAIPEAVGQGYVALLDEVQATGKTVSASGARVELLSPNGELAERFVDFVMSPVTDETHNVTGIMMAGADVTERVIASRNVIENEERLRLAIEAADIGLWELDISTGKQVWPRRIKAMFGISAESQVSMDDFHNGIHPDDRESTIAAFEAAMDSEKRAIYDVEYRTVGKEDGVVRWVAARGRGFFDDNGICHRVVGTAIDVSQRKLTATRLQEREATLRETVAALDALIENAPIGFAFFDREYRYVRLNSTLAAMNGISIDAHIGHTIAEIVPTLAPQVHSVIDRIFETGEVYKAAEIAGETAADPGAERAWLDGFFPVFGPDGKVAYVGATVVEITERTRVEKAVRELNQTLEKAVNERTAELAESERRFRAIFDSTFQLAGLSTLDGTIVLVNQTALDAVDTPIEGAVGLKVWDAPWWAETPEEQLRVRDAIAKASAGEFVRYDAAVSLLGTRKIFDFSIKPISGDDGQPAFLLAEARDITDQRLAEEALRQSQKMEAVGQLTGGIAHDFNNLLQGVSGTLQLILRRPDDRDRVVTWANMGLESAKKGARLTAQMLAFSRSQKLELKSVRPNVVIERMRELLERTLGPTVRIILEPGPVVSVLTDEVQLEMALLNLAINARDAMPDGGDLRISTKIARIVGAPNLKDGEYLEITVADTGVGMEPEIAAKAFDPFFTTKTVGQGTGLGLSQVYGTMKQAGGSAWIESTPGIGTAVHLYLSTVESEISTVKDERDIISKEPESRTVLVIDDDAGVLQFLTDSLELLGYSVLQAEDGYAGIAAFDRSLPDIVIVDYAMPGMTGAEVARQIQTRSHAVPIVFITGYSDTSMIEAVAGPDSFVLRKPFQIVELEEVLAKTESLVRAPDR